jgi:hypothetical protein
MKSRGRLGKGTEREIDCAVEVKKSASNGRMVSQVLHKTYASSLLLG